MVIRLSRNIDQIEFEGITISKLEEIIRDFNLDVKIYNSITEGIMINTYFDSWEDFMSLFEVLIFQIIRITAFFLSSLFNILTLFIYFPYFSKTTLNFTEKISEELESEIITKVLLHGGIPRNYLKEYKTLGFVGFKLGSYLLILSLLWVIINYLLKSLNNSNIFLFLVIFPVSISLLIIGRFVIRKKIKSLNELFI